MGHCRHALIGSSLAAVLTACNNPEASTTAASTTSASSSSTASTGDTTTSTTSATPTTTDATTTASTTTGDATTDCPVFIGCLPDPDLECDPFAQNCPEGQKCAAWADNGGGSWNATKCVPVQPDPDGPGEPCTTKPPFGVSGEDSCAKGLMCWEVDGNGQGTCVALCTGSLEEPACASACEYCLISNQGVLNLCLPQCDPLAQDCINNDLCIPDPGGAGGFGCILDGENNGVLFDACEFVNGCDRGLFCGDPSDAVECDPQFTGCCLPYCDPDGPACPGVGQACTPWPLPSPCHAVHACTLPN